MSDEIKAVIDKFLGGEEQSAFFELVDIPGNVISQLTDSFRVEPPADVRAFIVKTAWDRPRAIGHPLSCGGPR